MAITQAMWVHGHSMRNEDPALNVVPIGWAGQLRHLNSQGWYHIAIPTTVIVTDIRQNIDSAMVQFDAGPQASLRNFHIYDGYNRIANYDGLNLTGVGQFPRFPVPGRPLVFWGIGISMNFALGADPTQAWVDVHSAGVDFV